MLNVVHYNRFVCGGELARAVLTRFMTHRSMRGVAGLILGGQDARAWGAPASECKADNSLVIHPASGRQANCGKVVVLAATVQLDAEPASKLDMTGLGGRAGADRLAVCSRRRRQCGHHMQC